MLFAYPFRIFFVSSAVLALVFVPAWLGMLLTGWQPPLPLPPLRWHQHEMLFGLLDAAIGGFLLTAVCSWTGTRRLHGAALAGLWSVWLCARGLMLLPMASPPLIAAVDLAFLPLVILDAGRRIWSARQHRHWLVIVVLALLWLMDIGFHFSSDLRFVHGALVMAMALMLVIGGRITPAFSGNWLRATGREAHEIRVVPALERLLAATMLLLLACVVFGVAGPPQAALALAAGLLAAVRILRWKGWRVRDEPLLWILHLALCWIPVALLLMAASAMGQLASSSWVHAAGVGAMASLILGVMSRVALGHTGRPLQVPPAIVIAFVAILCAGVVRVATALGLIEWRAGLIVAASLWVGAFALFLMHYTPILAAPRVDGKEG